MPGIVFGKHAAGVQRSPRNLLAGKWAVVCLVLMVVLIAGAAVYYAAGHWRKPLNVDQQVEQANAKGDYAKAARLREGQRSASVESQIELAMAYGNAKQYKQAFSIFDKLAAAGQLHYSHLETAAGLAQESGDKAKAIAYYQDAKRQVITDKVVTAESRIQDYDEKIEALGGKP